MPPTGNFADKAELFLKKSLAALQLDYVDLYLIHFPVAQKFTEEPIFPTESVDTDHISLWKVSFTTSVSVRLMNFFFNNKECLLAMLKFDKQCDLK